MLCVCHTTPTQNGLFCSIFVRLKHHNGYRLFGSKTAYFFRTRDTLLYRESSQGFATFRLLAQRSTN